MLLSWEGVTFADITKKPLSDSTKILDSLAWGIAFVN